MSEKRDDEPEFLRELAAESPELAALSHDALTDELPVEAPSPAIERRLLREVSELPLRYAPFFDALSALWDLKEQEVERELLRARDREEWRFTALPGIRLFDVRGGPRTAGSRARLVRFAPGLAFPHHEHRGHEQVLILEGSYTDSGGTVYRSGDLHEMSTGTEHGFVVDAKEPCVAAVLEEGRVFRSLFLRVLSKLVRDD